MYLEVNTTLKRKAKTVKIHMKVCDEFSYQLIDEAGDCILDQENGSVPSFMPGEHYGDYLILDIDVETGNITNWRKLVSHEIESNWPDVE